MGLLVISANFLAGSVIVSLVAWGVALWRGRRRRWVGATGFGVLAMVLSLVTAADFVNAHYAFLPRVADVLGLRTWPSARLTEVSMPLARPEAAHPHGAVVSVPLPGVESGFGNQSALVYFPPQYFTEPTRRFPVVYLLHGSPGAPVDWFRAARASDAGFAVAREGHPVILVAPRASHNWTDDSECVDRPREHVATYLVKDVVREVDARFRTIATRGARAVAGNSAGGYCALNLGLRNRAAVLRRDRPVRLRPADPRRRVEAAVRQPARPRQGRRSQHADRVRAQTVAVAAGQALARRRTQRHDRAARDHQDQPGAHRPRLHRRPAHSPRRSRLRRLASRARPRPQLGRRRFRRLSLTSASWQDGYVTRPSSLDPAIAERLKRDPAGLIAAIAQQHDTGEVLMLGWMDDEALHRTLTTGRCTYWSRSRQEYWVKGDTSGHQQWVKSVALDCDGDAVLVRVDQVGAACHTGDRTCFDAADLGAVVGAAPAEAQ